VRRAALGCVEWWPELSRACMVKIYMNVIELYISIYLGSKRKFTHRFPLPRRIAYRTTFPTDHDTSLLSLTNKHAPSTTPTTPTNNNAPRRNPIRPRIPPRLCSSNSPFPLLLFSLPSNSSAQPPRIPPQPSPSFPRAPPPSTTAVRQARPHLTKKKENARLDSTLTTQTWCVRKSWCACTIRSRLRSKRAFWGGNWTRRDGMLRGR